MKITRILWLASVMIAAISFSSCKKDKGSAKLSVYLTDAPAAYDAVNIDVARVEIKSSDDQSDNGWQTLTLAKAGVYNVLDFRNGMDVLLASVDLPAGRVSQMRLILGTNNSIVVNGTTLQLPLQTPSAQTSGLKFNIHADLTEGVTYKVWIDFDAARSVVSTGSNSYILKPTVRTFTEATSGSIKGIALPMAAAPVASAISGTDTLSAMPDANGNYLIRGVPAGNWKVFVDGSNGYSDSAILNVNVVLGQLTNVGTVTLKQ
ncbi:MAG: DUF4382 domain-containing protein [Chitinophagaceae bacterium]